MQGYADGKIQIENKIYNSSVIITPDEIIHTWPPQNIAELKAKHCQFIVDLKPEVVIIGSGVKQIFPHMDVLGAFAQAGIGVEVMDTGAACRTYNVLALESRHVIAALLPI